jgi:hypothetical protein
VITPKRFIDTSYEVENSIEEKFFGHRHDQALHLVTASKDFLGIAQVISCFPIDFMMSLARGFHYLPTLWGDETVRQANRIVDFQGGLKAAGKVWKLLVKLDMYLVKIGTRVWLLRRHFRLNYAARR